MSWAHGYRKKDPKRVCDICGVQMFFSELKYIGQNRWACSDDAPGLTEYQISKHNARVKPLLVRQVKHPRSLAQTPTYLTQEAKLFALVRDQWALRDTVNGYGAGSTVSVSQSSAPNRMAFAAIYFSELLIEGTRPTSWLVQAAQQLRLIGDLALASQYGSPSAYGALPSEAADSVLYGFILLNGATNSLSETTAFMGLAMLRAYRLLGDTKYLDGANRVATCMRQTFQFRQTGQASIANTTKLYLGGFADDMTIAKVVSGFYSLRRASIMWFLSELRKTVGGSAVYGATSATGDFLAAPAATLDTILSDARSFYAGNRVSGFTNPTGTGFAPMSMLSATTPREYYGSAPSTGSGAYGVTLASSQYTVPAISFYYGLRGLYEYEGYSATVASIYEWLMSFTSNTLNQQPAGTSSFTAANNRLGTYDPNIALALTLAIADSTGAALALDGTGTVYDTTSAGLLAPVRIASGRDLSDAKAALTPPRRILASHTDTNDAFAYPLLRGACGLSFQMTGPGIVGTNQQAWAVTQSAAQGGLVYRYDPRAAPGVSTPS